MVFKVMRKRVGRTPLIRAKKLEKELHFEKIYLKLEGNNPSGHREDRLAYLTIRDAVSRGKKIICMGTYGNVGGSLSFLSRDFDIKCVFYVPNRNKIIRKDLLLSDNVEIIEYGRTYADCVKESRRIAEENGWYDANPGFANNLMNMYSFSYIAGEINRQLSEEKIESVYCQTSNGSSISGLHLGFNQLWIREEIDNLPKIHAVSAAYGNAIIESYKKGVKNILVLGQDEAKESRYNRNMISRESFNGQDALNAVYDTSGRAIGITDEELTKHGKFFRKLEKLHITLPNSYPIAAFMIDVEKGKISPGTHVIILNDGMIDLDISIMEKDELDMSYKQFLNLLDDWLVEFTDPIEEMEEAVENAFEYGFVLCATEHGSLVGIAILSRTRFDTFLPKYHLSYIATKKDVKGKGIATQLIEKAIELSKGDLSLHVETHNKRAIKLYEKMGLRKLYYRMAYKGVDSSEQ